MRPGHVNDWEGKNDTINIPCYDKSASVYLTPFKKCTWLDIFKQQFAEKHLTYTKGEKKIRHK